MRPIKQQFIPNKENDYNPHVLQKSAVVGMAILILLTFAISNIQSFLWISSDWLVSTVLPAVIVSETNIARADDALVELQRNDLLDIAAQEKAEDMAKLGYFSHTSPAGVNPWYWFKDVGYNYVHAGENLAVHFTDSEDVVTAWLNSPTHRDNILNANYREIGVGSARGTYEGYDTIFVVQLFGTPAASAADLEQALEPFSIERPVSSEEANLGNSNQEQVAGEQVSVESLPEVVENPPVVTKTTHTIQANEDHTVISTNHISTSTGAVPAYFEDKEIGGTNESTASWLGFATQPKLILQTIYLLLGLFVVTCLIMSILIEIRHQRPMQIGYGVGLLMLMYVLLQVHLYMIGGVVIV